MYKLIRATENHARQIIPYLSITCYWKEFVEGNLLNQSYEEFMLEWIIKPRIPHTTVLVKEGVEDIVKGCIVTATTDILATMPDYTPHLHHRVIEVFGPWFEYPISNGVMVELIAVDKELQGQGFGSKLYEIAEDLAKQENKKIISGFIWACFPNSLINAIKAGRMVAGCVRFKDPVKVPLLYLEKNLEFMKMKDYFQTEEYINTKNLLLN